MSRSREFEAGEVAGGAPGLEHLDERDGAGAVAELAAGDGGVAVVKVRRAELVRDAAFRLQNTYLWRRRTAVTTHCLDLFVPSVPQRQSRTSILAGRDRPLPAGLPNDWCRCGPWISGEARCFAILGLRCHSSSPKRSTHRDQAGIDCRLLTARPALASRCRGGPLLVVCRLATLASVGHSTRRLRRFHSMNLDSQLSR